MHLLDNANLNDAKRYYGEGRVSYAELAAWLPGWCVGKSSFRWHNDRLESWCAGSALRDNGYWSIETWAHPDWVSPDRPLWMTR